MSTSYTTLTKDQDFSTTNFRTLTNDELKLLCLIQFFPEVAQTSLSFPCAENSMSIQGLWHYLAMDQ